MLESSLLVNTVQPLRDAGDFTSTPILQSTRPILSISAKTHLERLYYPRPSTSSSSSPSSSPPLSPSRQVHQRHISPLKHKSTNLSSHGRSASARLSDFFAPYASPGPEEYPSAEDYEMESKYTGKITGRQRQNSTASLASVVTGRLSWFKNAAFAKPESPEFSSSNRRSSQEPQDPLLSMDIHSTLFPNGQPDYATKATFQDLLDNAEAMITKLQAAYKAKCHETEDLRAENNALSEDLDESETRAQHLKTQLDDMSIRMAKNEEVFENKLKNEQGKSEDMETRLRRAEQRPSGLWTSARSETGDSGFESEGENEPKTPRSPEFSENGFEPASPLDSPFSFKDSKLTDLNHIRYDQNNSFMTTDLNLRNENYQLKSRIAELESTVDSCLSLLHL